MPEIEVEGWLTSLDLPAEEIVKPYQGHGTQEQFHSEFKSDLDIPRAIGQATLIHPDSPVRHPAKRRRIRTVM